MDAGVCLTGTDIISSTTETIDDTDNYLVGQQRDTRTRHSVVVIDFDYSAVDKIEHMPKKQSKLQLCCGINHPRIRLAET
jgi:hypothetical protein